MAVHLVGFHAPAVVRLTVVDGGGVSRELPLDAAAQWTVTCRKGEAKSAEGCEDCPHFVRWTDTPGVLCRFESTDPVSAVMTRGQELLAVRPELPARFALATLVDERLDHLLVVDESGHLRGVLSRRDLVPAPRGDEPVAARMATEVFALPSDASIGEALAAMAQLGVGVLPVVAGALVVGVVSRGDLERLGFQPAAQRGSP